MQESDLIIIGGGIVGLATGLPLSRTLSGQDRHRAGKGSVGRQASDGPQLGRDAYGHLLPARVAQGDELPRRQEGDGGVLHEARTFRSTCAARSSSRSKNRSCRGWRCCWKRGPQNGVVCNRIGPEQIREIEPHCVGLAGIHVPEAGVVDYAQVCRTTGRDHRRARQPRRHQRQGDRHSSRSRPRDRRNHRPVNSRRSKSSTAPGSTAIASRGSAARSRRRRSCRSAASFTRCGRKGSTW